MLMGAYYNDQRAVEAFSLVEIHGGVPMVTTFLVLVFPNAMCSSRNLSDLVVSALTSIYMT